MDDDFLQDYVSELSGMNVDTVSGQGMNGSQLWPTWCANSKGLSKLLLLCRAS